MILSYSKQLWKLLLLGPALLLGVALLWGGILALVIFGLGENSAPSIGTIWFSAVGGGAMVYLTLHLFLYRFPMAISMGLPRKTIFFLNTIVVLGVTLVMWGLSLVLIKGELGFLQSIQSQRPGFDLMLMDFAPWWFPALLLVGCSLLGLAISAVLLRYGAGLVSKLFMVVWLVYILSQSLLEHLPGFHTVSLWILPILVLAQLIWAIRQFFIMTL